ncbi:hypothetical protein E4U60_006543 [Claviceps pazoutovae]|uniref:Integral membrane bound transporter domain-containing protein n=1 Tax=Claviceps pazoutovae TaxID=1649127 RepID=A0A9P7MGK3_9HYPO|nr:hypothetical protein E4U60_006543 [Claviceps pazoutovae]
MSIAQINQVLSDNDLEIDIHGASEFRDGHFDANFLRPFNIYSDDLLVKAKDTLPRDFKRRSPLKRFLPRQMHRLGSVCHQIATTEAGIRFLKTFLAYLIAYMMCLAPSIRDWLGRHHYMIVVSVILNHPARTIGAQIEGTILTIIGTAVGLGWAVLGLLLSTSTLAASAGYGGILALFIALFVLIMTWIRAFFIRFYQGVLCAGIAVIFTTLVETDSRTVSWSKLRDYAIPWLFGQAIALAINVVIVPDAGARALATALHESLLIMQKSLEPQEQTAMIRRRLAATFVDLSEACRDMRSSLTISRFQPDQVEQLRNRMQAVIRALLSLQMEVHVPDSPSVSDDQSEVNGHCAGNFSASESNTILHLANSSQSDTSHAAQGTRGHQYLDDLQTHTSHLLSSMKEALSNCDAVLMDISGYRHHLGPSSTITSDLGPAQKQLRRTQVAYDILESEILNSMDLPTSPLDDENAVKLLILARYVRKASANVKALLEQVESMQQIPDWPRVHFPSYPIWKAVHRANAQVRHDCGGLTARYYEKTFADIAQLFDKIKSAESKATSEAVEGSQRGDSRLQKTSSARKDKKTDGLPPISTQRKLRYKIWKILYYLQGFESKFAFKVCLVTSLLSVPSYLHQSRAWWDEYEVWWAVVMSWVMMQPRVGGNIQDLLTRSGVAVLGALWSGVGYAAGHGSPYVMGVFAALYMGPMLYQYSLSSHPRSGLAGCLCFTIVSLGLQAQDGAHSPALLATLRGLCFFVGIVVPILASWVLWPFVARHELRVALSSTMIFMSILYQNVVAKYVYFRDGKDPTPEDVVNSETLEGRLREGFVRIRQLLVLTRHELRLRAPFDPLPYSALSHACEQFFDYLITVRQSALFYNPSHIRDEPIAAKQLLSYRRDAAAPVLGNLYILAGALRSQTKVPYYMPSAAAARKRLLLKTDQVEQQIATRAPQANARQHKMWSDVYSFSYHESLTGCVAQLEELEKYTKMIVGQQRFDDEFSEDEEEDGNDEEIRH